MNNKNIFVDFDGTLVDIAPRHYRSGAVSGVAARAGARLARGQAR